MKKVLSMLLVFIFTLMGCGTVSTEDAIRAEIANISTFVEFLDWQRGALEEVNVMPSFYDDGVSITGAQAARLLNRVIVVELVDVVEFADFIPPTFHVSVNMLP